MSVLTLAGRALPQAEDVVRRYCGLEWPGGPAETWAFPYFDAVASPNPNRVDPSDVTACAALHPGLSRQDLEYFQRGCDPFERWLAGTPTDIDLADAEDELLAHLAALSEHAGPVSLSLLSKVAHRKRPRLVPMLDRAIVDWYRPVTGERGQRAWSPLLVALRGDLQESSNRHELDRISALVRSALNARVPTPLRVLDIAVWMESGR